MSDRPHAGKGDLPATTGVPPHPPQHQKPYGIRRFSYLPHGGNSAANDEVPGVFGAVDEAAMAAWEQDLRSVHIKAVARKAAALALLFGAGAIIGAAAITVVDRMVRRYISR